MQSDAPAAFPLIALVTGLLFASSWRDAAGFALVAILLLMLRRTRVAIVSFALATGIVCAVHARSVALADARVIAAIANERFVVVNAAIDRDWMRRGAVSTLRVARFRLGERVVEQPLMIITRFVPRTIDLQDRVVAEGFLRANERDELTLIVKSPRLLRYVGRASLLAPSTWNRALANRLRPFATAYPTEVALVEALALGRGERLESDVRDGYKRAGTYHLLVFSGLQIALAAGALAALLRWFHSPRASDWSLLIFSIAAPLFIGGNASVARASIGIGLYATSRLLHRPTTLENLWCVAALLRLIIAPHDVTDAAFQLTYGGAGALLFVAKPLSMRRARWVVYAICVECVVTGMTLFHFHQVALGGSIATLILTPVISAMLFVSALTCAFPCAALLRCIGLLHAISMRLNDGSARFAGSFAAPSPVFFALGLLGCLATIALLRGRTRALAILGFSSAIICSAVAIGMHDVDRPTITILDVGQGDAILLRTPGHAILIDGGPSPSRLIPLLADRGVHRLDAVILTHAHPDHCGGLSAVLSRLDARELWISPRRFTGDCAIDLLETAAAERVPVHLVRDGDRMAAGTLGIQAFTADRTFRRAPENNSSVVLRVKIGKRVALLTGDIERDAESELAGRVSCVDVLKVAHHGSRTSSTPLLLDAIAPRLAFISCGRHNLFGHPHPEVLRAFRDRLVPVSRTDLNGTIDIEFERDHLFVHREVTY